MKLSLLLLLWLAAVSPFAHAADWLNWRKVGDATLTWGPFSWGCISLKLLAQAFWASGSILVLNIPHCASS